MDAFAAGSQSIGEREWTGPTAKSRLRRASSRLQRPSWCRAAHPLRQLEVGFWRGLWLSGSLVSLEPNLTSLRYPLLGHSTNLILNRQKLQRCTPLPRLSFHKPAHPAPSSHSKPPPPGSIHPTDRTTVRPARKKILFLLHPQSLFLLFFSLSRFRFPDRIVRCWLPSTRDPGRQFSSLHHHIFTSQQCLRYSPDQLPRAAEVLVAAAEAAASQRGEVAAPVLGILPRMATANMTQSRPCPPWRTRARSAK